MENQNTKPKFYSVKDLGKGKYEISIEIERDIFEKSYQEMLKKASSDVKIDGFRKGKVPASVVEEKLRESVLIETFEKIAPTYTWIALTTEKLDPVSPVDYSNLPKLDSKDPLKYTVTVTTLQKFTLCDPKKIKVKMQDSTVNDEDVKTALEEMKKNQETKEKEMNDNWAAEIGAKYQLKGIKTLEALKVEISKILQKQKTDIATREFEREVVREAVKQSKIVVPDEAMHHEAHEREHNFMHQLEDAKMKLEDYLKQANTTIEKLEEAWHKDAQEALEEHFLLVEFAKSREIKIDEKEFTAFVQGLNAPKEYLTNQGWLESIQNLFYKNKAYQALLAEVRTANGIADPNAKPKNEIIMN